MSTVAALERLRAVLERENAALSALDLGAAGGFATEKEAALAACAGPPAPEHLPVLRAVVAAAAENRRRLEHAMAVQGRIIALIARAAPAADGAGRYGGTPWAQGRSGRALGAARTLSARA